MLETMWDCYLVTANDPHKATFTLKLDFISTSVHDFKWSSGSNRLTPIKKAFVIYGEWSL